MNRIKLLLLSGLAAFGEKLRGFFSDSTVLYRILTRHVERLGIVLYAAHTAVESFTDTIFAISASLPATFDAAGYGSTAITYTVIGQVSSMMPYGSERSVNKFQPITGAVAKIKGAPDYGDGDMVMADIPADAGQVILKAAEASPNHYSMKITYPDGEIHYLDVINSSWKISGGKEGDAVLRTAKLGICRAPVIIVAP